MRYVIMVGLLLVVAGTYPLSHLDAAPQDRSSAAQSSDVAALGFLDSGLTVFAPTLPRPARRGHVAPGPGCDSRISPASTARCTSA